jgi:Fic-DOC domain mobile mystery protein B
MRWAFRRSRNADSLLREPFIRRLHEEMFGRVWRWAGDYRTTDRNLGIAAWSIREEIGRLLGDAQYWIAEGVFDRDELCIRYHHRLVSIHPFPNGNGRHSRLSADLLSVSLGGDPLGWGRGLVLGGTVLRATYIAALQAADRSDLAPLIDFGRARQGPSHSGVCVWRVAGGGWGAIDPRLDQDDLARVDRVPDAA